MFCLNFVSSAERVGTNRSVTLTRAKPIWESFNVEKSCREATLLLHHSPTICLSFRTSRHVILHLYVTFWKIAGGCLTFGVVATEASWQSDMLRHRSRCCNIRSMYV